MYRLVIVAGPNRGSSYSLIEGENSIGRQMDNHIVLTSSKISKRHCALLVTPDEVVFKDEGSTNGSFVNGAVSKRQVLKPGDKIGLGEFVLELARSISTQPNQQMSDFSAPSYQTLGSMAMAQPVYQNPQAQAAPQFQTVEPVEIHAPDDLPGKLKFAFEGKLMPSFYGMLMKTEYRSIMAMLFGAVTAISVVGSVMPMQDLAEQAIKREALIRARVVSREVADRFLPAVASHTESQIDLSLLENEESIKLVAITDPNLQIIAPQSRLNQLLAGGREAAYAVMMAKEFREGREKGSGGIIGDSTAIWVEPIKTNDPKQVKSAISAMSVVAIDFSGNMIQSGGMGVTYGIGFVIAGLASALAYFILLRLTFKPYEVLNDELDQVLRGEIPKVTREFMISELSGLWDNINAAVQRIPKGTTVHDFSSEEQAVNWDHEFAPVRAMAEASQMGFIGFDSSLMVVAMNPQFEEISGIRMDSVGQSIAQIARDQAFVSLVNDLKERVGNSPSRSALDEFEFSGVGFQVIGTSAGSIKDPGFAVIFRKRE